MYTSFRIPLSFGFLQIHVPVVGFDPAEKLVVVPHVDQDLGVSLDGLPQYAKGTGLEVDGVFVGFFVHFEN